MSDIVKKHAGPDHYIYRVAEGFYSAANFIPEEHRRPAFNAASYYVNLAFASELFLKSLYVEIEVVFAGEQPFQLKARKYEPIRGHDLLKVYSKLPEEIRGDIKQAYAGQFKKDFEEDLAEINTAFVDWRYYFEKDQISINASLLENMTSFLKDYCSGVKWNQVKSFQSNP